MEFRDILFDDNLDQPQSMNEYDDDDFQNIITYLGKDFLKKYMIYYTYFLNIIYISPLQANGTFR